MPEPKIRNGGMKAADVAEFCIIMVLQLSYTRVFGINFSAEVGDFLLIRLLAII